MPVKIWSGLTHGMGVGGWLTNYKRFHVLPPEQRLCLTTGDWEHFRSFITERDVAYIASLGMDHIRLGFDQLVVEEAEGCLREEIMCLIDAFITWCERCHLRVVLNMHKALGNYCDIQETKALLDDETLQNRFIAVWQCFEKRYASKSDVVFEILNEIRDVPPERWNALAQRTVRAIRALNPTRKIIVGSTRWNAPDALETLRVFDDENVGYTFHCYAPFEFTHQRGVLQTPCCFYNRDMPYPGEIERYRDYKRTVEQNGHAYDAYERMDRRYLADVLAPAFAFAQKHPDAMLWCGEFGTIRHAKMAWRENWMRDMIALLQEHGVPYCAWNYLSTPNDGNRFSLVDDDSRQILSQSMARILRGEV